MKICSAVLEVLNVDRRISKAKLMGAFLQLFVVNAPRTEITMKSRKAF
jgi:hypothetical protein